MHAPEGWSALALHLSRLAPPAPRPHQRRVACALLADAASPDGASFFLNGGDVVALCRGTVAPLAARCAKLLRLDAPDPHALLTTWSLQEDGDALLRFAASRLTDAAPGQAGGRLGDGGGLAGSRASRPPGDAGALRAATRLGRGLGRGALGDEAALSDLVRRQTAVLLTADDAAPIRLLFREILPAAGPMRARLAVSGHPGADPFLLRHVAGRLTPRVLDALLRAGGLDGPLAACGPGGQALHLNFTVPGALSPAFTRLAALARAAGIALGVEVALTDALADLTLFGRLRRALRNAAISLALDDVSGPVLAVTRSDALDADLVKLNWHPALPGARLGAALGRVGPDRIVLQHAGTEAAIAWGLNQGIGRFQGAYIDDRLAGLRVRACPRGKGCTRHQCAERASATGAAGRAGCRNPALLDSGAP